MLGRESHSTAYLYSESHVRFRVALKEFVQKEILPDAAQYDESGEPASIETFKKMGAFGWLAARIGPGPHLRAFTLPGGVKPEEFDYFQYKLFKKR